MLEIQFYYTGYRLLLIATYTSSFTPQQSVCEFGIVVQIFCEIMGTIGLLASVSETTYKSKHPTSLYNSCGKKMSVMVIVLTWVIAALWCLAFWMAELRYEEFKCLKESEQESPSMFQLYSSALVLLLCSIMVIIQAINLITAKRRLKSIKHHLMRIRKFDVQAYLQDTLHLYEGDIQKPRTQTDQLIRFKIIILNSLNNVFNDDTFLENKVKDIEVLSEHQSENIKLHYSFMWRNDIQTFDELFVVFNEYLEMNNCCLTINSLETFCEKLKENFAQFENEDLEKLTQLTNFVNQLISDVNVFDSERTKDIQYSKSVKAATTLFIILLIVIVSNIPAGYGLAYYFWNNYFISKLFFSVLALSNKARSIFTSSYILIVFRANLASHSSNNV